jgi:hypothetical protein
LIVSLGATPPPAVTSANYYTYLDLTQVPNYQTLTRLELRNMLPNANFCCSTSNVPFLTTEYNPEGGFMGQYVPTVDFPTPAEIPTLPTPPVRPDSCLLVPAQQPTNCNSN